jgi:hypothetical protein
VLSQVLISTSSQAPEEVTEEAHASMMQRRAIGSVDLSKALVKQSEAHEGQPTQHRAMRAALKGP